METKEYHTIDKTNWGKGPWQKEPDKMQFVDEATGLPCLIKRTARFGALCGYVGVAEGHPAYKLPYNDINDRDIDVHGGLTYADLCEPVDDESHGICHVPGPGEPDHVWWLGFDCAHADDLSPGQRALEKTIPDYPHFPFERNEKYRTVAYVKRQCAKLAKQLAAMYHPLRETP